MRMADQSSTRLLLRFDRNLLRITTALLKPVIPLHRILTGAAISVDDTDTVPRHVQVSPSS